MIGKPRVSRSSAERSMLIKVEAKGEISIYLKSRVFKMTQHIRLTLLVLTVMSLLVTACS